MTWLNTVVGAVPGALPPLMGWTAARGELSGEGWALFAIWCSGNCRISWPSPGFTAMNTRRPVSRCCRSWIPTAAARAQQAVSHTLALLVVSLCPFLFKMAGPVYLVGALVLGAGFLWCAIQFSRQLTLARARQLFFASILYLPLLLAVMVWDKVK